MVYRKTYSTKHDINNLTRQRVVIAMIVVSTLSLVVIIIASNTVISTRQQILTNMKSNALSILRQTVMNTTTPFNSSRTDIFYPNIAILVEFRAVDHIVTIVHNVNYNIPSTWPIQIFHGKVNQDFIKNSTLAPLIASGKIFLTLIEEEFYDKSRTNNLLTTPAFWKRVRGEKILFFQIDSAMCSNSPHKITDFLQYDYIGAPWNPLTSRHNKSHAVGNGGFSLRTRSKLLALLALVPYSTTIAEDIYYSHYMHRVNGSVAPFEIAKKFAVESVYYDRPLGVHCSTWSCEYRDKIGKTCPEALLVAPNRCL